MKINANIGGSTGGCDEMKLQPNAGPQSTRIRTSQRFGCSAIFLPRRGKTALPYPFGRPRASSGQLGSSPFWVIAVTAAMTAWASNYIGFDESFAYGSPASPEASTRHNSNGVLVTPPRAGLFCVWGKSSGFPLAGRWPESGRRQANGFIALPQRGHKNEVIGSRRTIYECYYHYARN